MFFQNKQWPQSDDMSASQPQWTNSVSKASVVERGRESVGDGRLSQDSVFNPTPVPPSFHDFEQRSRQFPTQRQSSNYPFGSNFAEPSSNPHSLAVGPNYPPTPEFTRPFPLAPGSGRNQIRQVSPHIIGNII